MADLDLKKDTELVSDFDLNEVYSEEKRAAKKYTRKALVDALTCARIFYKGHDAVNRDMDSTVKTIEGHCCKLFPAFSNIKRNGASAETKFYRNQFIYYFGKEKFRWESQGYDLVKILQVPSERYRQQYAKMLNEILENAEKLSINPQIVADIRGDNGGRYAESVHTVQQWISLIASSLWADYGISMAELKNNIAKFYIELYRYAPKTSELIDSLKSKRSFWDELCLLLAYDRDFYWEHDLLEAHKRIEKILAENSSQSRHLLYPDKDFLVASDNKLLAYKGDKIEEISIMEFGWSTDLSDNVPPEKYLPALESYVKEHSSELAQKVFCTSQDLKNTQRRIVRHFTDIKAYWEIETLRYKRFCPLSKAKLIAAYQVIFMVQPAAKANLVKKGAVQQIDNGLWRENNSLSSSYSNPQTKEPFYLQLLCLLTDSQLHLLSLPEECRKQYSTWYHEVNVAALEVIFAEKWMIEPRALQARAESVLFLTAESLISPDDDEDEFKELSQILRVKLPIDRHPLNRFGTYCRLFGVDAIAKQFSEHPNCSSLGNQSGNLQLIAEKDLRASVSVPKEKVSVSLNNASEGAVILHQLKLEIDCEPLNGGTYILKSFPSHSVEELVDEERAIYQRTSTPAGP